MVIPAQEGRSPALLDWVRNAGRTADVVMSVSAGAFLLVRTGLLDGKKATTHHDHYDHFQKAFPAVELVRGARFVEQGVLATAGGLTSGIDLALRVVARYFGPAVAEATATYMEYQSQGWRG